MGPRRANIRSVLITDVHISGANCTWLGDCLWVDKQPLNVASHLGQFSLPSLQG